jgi:phospholipid-binding lipoprotein MlaA
MIRTFCSLVAAALFYFAFLPHADALEFEENAGKPVAGEEQGDPYYEEEVDFPQEGSIADPLEPWNRAVYVFNDKAYFWFFKPVATGYARIIPEGGRVAVGNLFHNILVPIRLVNNLLQGRPGRAAIELGRFGYNTTVGLIGLFDAAKRDFGWARSNEDLRQTLGLYGLGNGFYIVWPFLGPSSLRDTVGLIGDSFLNPVNYISDSGTVIAVRIYQHVNDLSLRLGDYEDLKEAALDPYISLRDAYYQYVNAQIKK